MSAYQYPELVNISQTGAKLRGSALPPKNATALLKIDSFQTLCRVVWADHEQCGVRFEEPIPNERLSQIKAEQAITADMFTPTEQSLVSLIMQEALDEGSTS